MLFRFFVAVVASALASWNFAGSAQEVQPFLLQMIRDDAVHRELKLDEAEIGQVDQAIAEVDPRWWVSRILPTERQAAEIAALTQTLSNRLATFLDADQLTRLEQLQRQAGGTRMVRRADVGQALGLTPEQRQRLEKLFAETDAEMAVIQKELAEQKIDAEQAAKEVATEQRNERQGLLDVLTEDQRAKIGGLVGPTFDFSQVKRTYPRAPEFDLRGAQWLNGDAVRLDALRGKVVVVFFYAFECINCQRNFPHYRAWQDELAGEGVAVIGIQRPETSRERDVEAVRAAIRKDGFEFPVLFDADSANWDAWANTMWPTTYLIDKQGFVRRWWQGEMNWQGTPGEQQMRQTIGKLLAE